ncbi:uncharacterized protein LOC133745061 [Rosa rugosa]|uniref:uncharacterized protein LOC133745061 n=1 Tax=Rosa rugosa TaxID=74645 RepID=UPI002B415CC5|nr:uncharacterized protein LOC133745061 [Rosa rugosa]
METHMKVRVSRRQGAEAPNQTGRRTCWCREDPRPVGVNIGQGKRWEEVVGGAGFAGIWCAANRCLLLNLFIFFGLGFVGLFDFSSNCRRCLLIWVLMVEEFRVKKMVEDVRVDNMVEDGGVKMVEFDHRNEDKASGLSRGEDDELEKGEDDQDYDF